MPKTLEKIVSFRFKALLPPSSLSLQQRNMEATYSGSDTNVGSVWWWCRVRSPSQHQSGSRWEASRYVGCLLKGLRCVGITRALTGFP